MFDSQHVHKYYQGFLVGVNAGDGFNYGYTELAGGPVKLFASPTTLADIILATGMVESKAKLKKLVAQKGIQLTQWGWPREPYEIWAALPASEGEYIVRIGKWMLEVVVENPWQPGWWPWQKMSPVTKWVRTGKGPVPGSLEWRNKHGRLK